MSRTCGADTPARLRPLALTMGEPAGIGGELTLAAWRAARVSGAAEGTAPVFFAVDDPDRLSRLARALGLDVPVEAIAEAGQAGEVFVRALPVLPVELPAAVTPGRPKAASAPAVIGAIERAVHLVQDGHAAALVTNPIHKKTLYGAGFRYAGHTEFLAELVGATEAPVMMLACPGLRVIPVTVHIPLAKVASELSTGAIVHAGQVAAAALRRDFGVARPRLAVAGLNPHAGEDGTLGREEIEVIAPAARQLAEAGIEVFGPTPADTLFHGAARARYDSALCMYHDQALIPLKTIDFDHGVNITLGLPLVRTSPDHGTALDIAGQGKANPASLIAALDTAWRMAEARTRAASRSVA